MTTRHVTGTYLGADGTPLTGRLFFTPVTRLSDPPDIVLPVPAVVMLDDTGSFDIELRTTGTGQPSGWVWEVPERVGNTACSWLFDLPDDPDPLDLSTVTPVESWTGGGPNVTVSMTPPANPALGAQWVTPKVWNGTEWL